MLACNKTLLSDLKSHLLEQCSVHENSCELFSLLPCCPAPCMCLEASTASSWVTCWSSPLRDVRLLAASRRAWGPAPGSGVCGLCALPAASPGKTQPWSSSKRSLRTVLPSQVGVPSLCSLFWQVCRPFLLLNSCCVNCVLFQGQGLQGAVSWEPFLWPRVTGMGRCFCLLLLKLLVHEIFFLPCCLCLLFCP